MAQVLVVDDHDRVAQAVAAMARQSGYGTTVVNSGQAAMESLRASRADLVVLDVSMPAMSGLDVLRWIRANAACAETPVVMFSASEEYRDESLRLGAVGFVLKHEPDDLTAAFDKHLGCRNR